MKILIVGAGVLGSRYAIALQNVGHDVTIMARGKRLQDIREHGIILQSLNTEKREQAHFQTIEKLQPDDAYDLALVVIRGNQVPALLPTLQANQRIPHIAFLGNRIDGADDLLETLGEERVLTGFVGAAGIREEHIVKYLDTEKPTQGVTYLGAPSAGRVEALQKIKAAFRESVFPAQVIQRMDAWHKHHLALVIPLALGIYAAGGSNYDLAENEEVLRLMVRAIREGFRAFQKLGYPLTPSKFHLYTIMPEKLLVKLVRKLMTTRGAEIGVAGHANAAKDEMGHFADRLVDYYQRSNTPTPAFDRLYTYRP